MVYSVGHQPASNYGATAPTPTAPNTAALASLTPTRANILETLSAQNKLYGVDPNDLAAIAEAESSGVGGGINSVGYGGFFGLGVGHSYAGGSPSAALLQGTDPTSFAQQSEIASSVFAGLLKQAGGNPLQAEYWFQNGGGAGQIGSGGTLEGVNIFKKYGIGGVQGLGPTTDTQGLTNQFGASSGGTSGTANVTFTAAKGALGQTLQYLDGFLNPSIANPSGPLGFLTGASGVTTVASAVLTVVDRSLGILFGAGLVFVGLKLMTQGGGDSPSLIGQAIRTGGSVYTGKLAAETASKQIIGRTQVAQTRSSDTAKTIQARASTESNRVQAQQAKDAASKARQDAAIADRNNRIATAEKEKEYGK